MPDLLNDPPLNAPTAELKEALRQLMAARSPYPAEDMGNGMPPVAPPPLFRPMTTVQGGQGLAKSVENMFRYAPDLRGRIKDVKFGPNASVINGMMESGLKPDDFANTNLMGETSLNGSGNGRSIALNPNLGNDPFNRDTTLAHEMTHAAGWNREAVPERASDLTGALAIRRLLDYKAK